MLKLYELLAKVGTNPKLRAWAMEQIINLKKLKSSYKKSFTHQMDLNRVKDVRNPNWLKEQIAKEKSYDLKNKVVDITKAKDKVRWNKIEKTQDKDKFYGVTGQVQTHLKKITDDIDDMFKKDDAHMAWFSKTLRNSLKGDKKATIEIDRYFANMEKTAREKVVPFWPRKKSFKTPPGKAEGGRIGLDEGGPSQKDIDKGIAAIEKLKSSLMPESYEALIEIYKDKQKDLNIDIMESAGGLGEMLGEGGVAGHSPLALEQLPSQRRKKHIPHKFPKLGEGGRIGMMYGGDPGFAFSYGGSWADWKENHASEMPVMDYINQKLPKARNPFTDTKYQEGGEVTLSWEEVFKKYMNGETLTDDETVTLGQVPLDKKAEGGRIGMAKGDTPSEAYLRDLFYDGGWDAKGDIGLHEFMHGPIGANEWFKHNNKAEGGRIGFKKGGKGKGEGGIIEDDEFREFLDDRKNRDKDNFQRDFFEDFKKWKKWKEGNIQEAKDGGRMWQPKSAPQLTTTIPPESGPMPHGLTYLTGDDIVQNIGHKHGRN